MTPLSGPHLTALLDALEARLALAAQDTEGWMVTADLFARVTAWPTDARGAEAERLARIEGRGGEIEAGLAAALGPVVTFEPLVRRGEALADGAPEGEDHAIGWAYDVLALAAIVPLLPRAHRAEARRVLASCRSIVEISPEAFTALPGVAANRVELEPTEALPEVRAVLESFGEAFVNAIEQADETPAVTLHPALREVLEAGHRFVGGTPEAWGERMRAVEAAWVRREEAALEVVFRVTQPVAELRYAADGAGAATAVPPEAWRVLHETESVRVDVAEVPEGDGIALVVAVRSFADDLTSPDALVVTGPDGAPADVRVRVQTRSLWEAQLGRGGPWTIAVRSLRRAIRLAVESEAP